MDSIETTLTKNHKQENFPVGSWLLSQKIRFKILIFYKFARAADDIADSANLSSNEKIKRLNLFKKAIESNKSNKIKISKVEDLRKICIKNKIKINHALNLLKAFKQDAIKKRYKNWSELIRYCKYSAVPVGRFVIDLHKEKQKAYKYSDPLCIALQILNHLQDCKEDYENLDRVYLPMQFLKKYNVKLSQLKKNVTEKNLRLVFNEILKNTEKLIIEAGKNKKNMKHKHLSLETSFILEIAKKLLQLLKNNDPLKKKVMLKKFDYIYCFAKGLYL
jgi:squalene synthase HpnC